MIVEINGQNKKIACGPCIRGHRSSKCDHRDRLLLEVRKPGRPLMTCPHHEGSSCSCATTYYINFITPKNSECACKPDGAQVQPVTVASSTRVVPRNRIQKSQNRRSSDFDPAGLERAVRASEHEETDSLSSASKTSIAPLFPPSEKSTSSVASFASSSSSTPGARLSPPRHNGLSEENDQSQSTQTSASCCSRNKKQTQTTPRNDTPVNGQPGTAPNRTGFEQPQQGDGTQGRLYGDVENHQPQAIQTSAFCCSGNKQLAQTASINVTPVNGHPGSEPHQTGFEQPQPNGFEQSQTTGSFQGPLYGDMNLDLNYNALGAASADLQLGLQQSVFNWRDPVYHQHHPGSIATAPTAETGSCSDQTLAPHNCHCGPSCACLGCAAHPNNATTTNYVKSLHHYAQNSDGYGEPYPSVLDLPVYPHQPGFGAEALQNAGFNAPVPNFGPGQPLQEVMGRGLGLSQHSANPIMGLSNAQSNATMNPAMNPMMNLSDGSTNQLMGLPNASMNPMTGVSNAPDQWTVTWQHMPSQAPDPFVGSYAYSNLTDEGSQPQQLVLKTEESDMRPGTGRSDSPIDNRDEDVQKLSPSSFWFHTLPIDCTDPTGTCQCGDGCACDGCLTHGGHTGETLGDVLPLSTYST